VLQVTVTNNPQRQRRSQEIMLTSLRYAPWRSNRNKVNLLWAQKQPFATSQRRSLKSPAQRAEQDFRANRSPDTVAYNTLLDRYAQEGDASNALDLVRRMRLHFDSGRNNECRPNMKTYNSLLKALLISTLPDASEKAEKLFKALPSPDSVTYSTLIDIYTQKGDVEKAINLVKQMQTDFNSGKKRDCQPYLSSYDAIINAIRNSNLTDAIEKAEQIFSIIRSPDTVTYTSLLHLYEEHGEVEKALDLVHRMISDFNSKKNKKCQPDILTYRRVLKALRNSNLPDAVEKAEQLLNAIASPDRDICNAFLKFYTHKYDLDRALNLVHQMQVDFDSKNNKHCRPTMRTYNILLNTLQNWNRSDAAEKVEQIFNALPLPNTDAYNALINVSHRVDVEKALSLVNRMLSDFDSGKNKNCLPNMHTYQTILTALRLSKPPNTVERAEQIFATIPSPDTIAFNTLLHIYADHNLGENAVLLTRRMQADCKKKKSICLPNSATEVMLMKAIRNANDPDLEIEGQDVLEWFSKRKLSEG
jgi:pentatricopeptide repeat protein